MSVRASIISACYNHGKYIPEMLESVFNQTFQNFEVIIVNDGSSDNTKGILDKIKHEKVRIFHTENHGPAHARNYAIQRAVGEIVMNLDADDRIAPTFLEKCVSVLDSKPKVGIVYSDVEFFGAKTGLYKLQEATIENMLFENRIVANACFRKSDWKKTSGYYNELYHDLEDYDFWLSILELGREIFKIDESLVFYRTYKKPNESRSVSSKENIEKVYENIILVFKRHEKLYKKFPKIWGYFTTLENKLLLQQATEKPDLTNNQSPQPTFSIITPTCRRPKLLKRSIQSVLNQSFKDFELLIIDDANDPETVKIILDFNSNKIRYFAHDNQRGASAAYNSGIKLARGQYINFLDDDDEYLPGILEKIFTTFQKTDDKIGFIWTGIVNVSDTENGEEILNSRKWSAEFHDIESGLIESTTIGNGFGLSIRKECVRKIGYYDESLKVGVDTDFMIRLSAHFAFQVIPEVLIKIHHGNSQLTDKKNDEIRWQSYKKIIEKHFIFLSQYWRLIYIHSSAYWSLCYKFKKRTYARKMFWKLIRKFPCKFVLYADLICYELFKKNYEAFLNLK